MKKLKHIAEDKNKEFKKLFIICRKKVNAFHKKIGDKVYSTKDEHDEYSKIMFNLFDPANKMEKEYIQAKLNYINSQEYKNSEYPADRKKYDKMIIDINSSLKKLKKIYSRAVANGTQGLCVYMAGYEKKHGARKYDSARPKDFINAFISLKETYAKKHGYYNYEDAKKLFSSNKNLYSFNLSCNWAKGCEGKEIISEKQYMNRFHIVF